MIGFVVALLFAAWFFRSARKVGKHSWGWAVIGLLSYYLPVFLFSLVIGTALPNLRFQFGSQEEALAVALAVAFAGLLVGAASATIVRTSFLREASSWTFREAAQDLKAAQSLGTPYISIALFCALLASGLLRFIWSVASSHFLAPTAPTLNFGVLWYAMIMAGIVLNSAGATLIVGTVRSWLLIPLVWATLVAGLYALKQYGLSHLITNEQQRMMAEHSLNWIISLSVFVGAFLPLFLVSVGIRFWGGRLWVFLLGMLIGTSVVHIPVMNQLKSNGMLRWDLILSPVVEGLLWGGGLYLGLLATGRVSKDRVGRGDSEPVPSPRGDAANENSGKNESVQVSPSIDELRAKERAARDQKVISACAFAGGASFFALNIATGVVPGGFIGGAIGGGLGAVIGMIINSLRRD